MGEPLLETHNWLVFKPGLLLNNTSTFSVKQIFYCYQLETNHCLFHEPLIRTKAVKEYRARFIQDKLRPVTVPTHVRFLSFWIPPRGSGSLMPALVFRICFSYVFPCWADLPVPSLFRRRDGCINHVKDWTTLMFVVAPGKLSDELEIAYVGKCWIRWD